MKASGSSALLLKDEVSRPLSQMHHCMTAKNPEMCRHGREAGARIRQPTRVFWSCLLLVCVVGIPIGHTRQTEARKAWKSIRYKDLPCEIPEAFVVQQGRVLLLSLVAVFFGPPGLLLVHGYLPQSCIHLVQISCMRKDFTRSCSAFNWKTP
jgi:hypothetical protein